jgi:hypothetical protein
MNTKGISVLFLVIAMLLMVAIGYVFSYLIPAKQKSVIFPIQSNQAFFIAQSGVEFAVRYASDNSWTTFALLTGNLNGVTRNLGGGRFTLTYNYATYGDTLISVGEVPIGTERRRINVFNFTAFLPTPMVLAAGYDVPCWCLGTRRMRFYIQNVGSTNVTIDSFSATWNQVGQPKTIQRIDMNAVQKYSGNYSNGSAREYFNQGGNSQTVAPGQVIETVIYWSGNTNGNTIVINFFSPAGNQYIFELDPGGTGFGSCPHPC